MKNVSLITGLLLGIPLSLFGQTTGGDIRSLAETVAAEKQRVAELQAELERHNAVLMEISKRLDAITTANTPDAAVAPSVASVESATPRFDFYGESVMRLDNLRQSYADCSSCPMRTRAR